ncbi:MAG: M28 family peptidase, partial [Phycisphaeraceae bacterium]|nr:M28 family peptidase [Phycisphaeraceae bacterium]
MTGNSRVKRCCGLWVCLMLAGSGCVSMPAVELSPEIASEELSDHVHFLAQPRLKGRKPLSRGSALSRRYMSQQFEALGLAPWEASEGFVQPFVLGTNVVGVLPGSDPNLAQEIVILSAHYDHLGRTKEGLCLGAADNAAGVAALLEIAESLVLKDSKPKRSICFAAFDQEENGLLGAFAFSCRDDFDPNRIAGVVNIDLLGRSGFEALENHLFLSGTEDYREIRRQIQAAAATADITILPAGTDIVGPRADHVAF